MRIARYGKTRYWAVYDGAMLVCVCVQTRRLGGPTALVEQLTHAPRPYHGSEGLFLCLGTDSGRCYAATNGSATEAGSQHNPGVFPARQLPDPGAWPERCPYLTRSAPPWGCMRGLCPCMRKPWAGSPAELEWQPSATVHQRCVAMQAIAALTASWGERVGELAPHLTTPLGERL